MKRKLTYSLFALVFLSVFIAPQIVSAKSSMPLATELDVQLTYFSPYNVENKIKDALISGNTVDLMFLEAIQGNTKLDLGKSVWESTFSTIVNNNAYSDTLGNASWNTATSDGMTVTTEATANSAETLVTFKGTSNATAVAQYAQALSYFAWDGNDDGDYVDTADRGYLPHDENIFILVNNEMTSEDTDDSAYSTVEIILETTTSTDYSIILKFWEKAGDSGWDFTTSNGATLEFFDCSGSPIVTTLDIAAILEADSESVAILGSDYFKQYVYRETASKYVQNELKNIAYYTSQPAFTDDVDGDSDWDMDGSDEYIDGIDGTDFLFTIITQDTTDTYDSSQELLADQSGSIITKVPARYLYFTGAMAVYPDAGSSYGSSTIESGKYLTTESLSFDTREINSLDSLANVLSVSTWKLNMTLEDSICWDTDHYVNNLVAFSDNGIDKFEVLKTAFTVTVDDSEVQYDIADPSTSDGDLDSLSLQVYTKVNYGSGATVPSGGGTATASSDNSILILLGAVLLLVTIWYFKIKK
jgi:hypothetical protein